MTNVSNSIFLKFATSKLCEIQASVNDENKKMPRISKKIESIKNKSAQKALIYDLLKLVFGISLNSCQPVFLILQSVLY